MPEKKKAKLRTVSDIVARLRWEQAHPSCMLGYDDRIIGPLETPLEDYKPISKGGDLPEHRIWYVRCGNDVLWDKLGRVDRLFGSGNGDTVETSQECLRHIQEAEVNLELLEQEKEERRLQKQKDRARKARSRARSQPQKVPTDNYFDAQASDVRFRWTTVPAFEWTANTWTPLNEGAPQKTDHDPPPLQLVFVTWNVLFDIFDGEKQETKERWTQLVAHLQTCNADVIALQEVTPDFVDILLNTAWVRAYATTCSLQNTTSVAPSGNMLLWKKSLFTTTLTELCIDGGRRRATIAVLQHGTTSYAVATVHLPANHGEQKRDIARQRELAAVLGRLQQLEGSLGPNSVPVVLGDFNSDEDSIVRGDTFTDAWRATRPDDPGVTFSPETNVRAARTVALTDTENFINKRIDRIFVGTNNDTAWECAEASLVGTGDLPPSDHYGIQLSIPCKQKSTLPCMSQPQSLQTNVWAANAPTSVHSLLGLVIRRKSLGGRNFFDSQSSLPVPHITLLHGFVEFDQYEDLLTEILNAAVTATVQSLSTLCVKISLGSIEVFEHKSSATLVCCPDATHTENKWLLTLYQGLRALFPQCHEQESRFSDLWKPHISLGKFGTVSQARAAAGKYAAALHETMSIDVNGLAAFKRSSDGKFHPRAVVSLISAPKRIQCCNTKCFLANGGKTWTAYFQDLAGPVLSEINRAVRVVAGPNFETKVKLYGSHALGVSLPGLSDIDAVLELTATDDNAVLNQGRSTVLSALSEYLQCHIPECKTRFRKALKLQILTVKLFPAAPAIDLIVCLRCASTMSEESVMAQDAIRDTEYLSLAISDWRPAFQTTLRFIKLWAQRRQVYGLGYLGGGGYAIWLAKILIDSPPDHESPIALAVRFFREAAKQANELPIHVGLRDHAFDQASQLSVKAPISHADHGRNTTRSVVHAIQMELHRAVMLLGPTSHTKKDISQTLEIILSPISSDSFLIFESILLVKLSCTGKQTPELKALGGNQMLSMLVALEFKLGDPSRIRPFMRPIHRTNTLVWMIGVQCSSLELHNFAHREAAAFQSALFGADVVVECLKSSEGLITLEHS